MGDSLLGLSGKVALVTGAGLGIGKGCALMLARAGADLAIADLNDDDAERTADEIRGLGRRATALRTDVRRSDEIETLLARTVEQLGHLEVCVNNVGGLAGHRPRPFLESTPDFFDAIVENNLRATYFCCLAEARTMIARGVRGTIINISSVGGLRAVRGIAPYGAAKAGVINLTQNLAIELAPHGIRVNAIAPGTTATEFVRARMGDGHLRPVEEANPMGRLARPEDIGGAVVYLASDLADYVTGHTLVVDGGVSVATPRPAP
jgi:NAD(P)-dependent dehydrogenase (short-subunit alcohol dehydrogenase family)